MNNLLVQSVYDEQQWYVHQLQSIQWFSV